MTRKRKRKQKVDRFSTHTIKFNSARDTNIAGHVAGRDININNSQNNFPNLNLTVIKLSNSQNPARQLRESQLGILNLLKGTLGTPTNSIDDTIFGDEPPTLPKDFAPRTQLVDETLLLLSIPSWVSIIGGAGFGKTTFAHLVVQNYTLGDSIWINVPISSEEFVVLHIKRQLARFILNKLNPVLEFNRIVVVDDEFLGNAIDFLNPKSLIVIDDLPMLDVRGTLYGFLSKLGVMLHRKGHCLLTTGQSQIPSSGVIGIGLSEVEIQPFDADDVGLILREKNLPTAINLETFIALVLASTGGHPALVMAIISWFESLEWKWNTHVVDNLLAGTPLNNLRNETVRFLHRLIPSDSVREFLFRLSLLPHSFDLNIAQAVANVDPPIPLVGEKLMILTGPWLTKTTKGNFQISPLLRDSGNRTLSPKLQVEIHKAVADELLSQSPITIDRLQSIVIHLFASDQGDRLAKFVIHVILSTTTKNQAESISWLSGLFLPDAPRQLKVLPSLLVIMRAQQIRLLIISGRNYDNLLSVLDMEIGALDLAIEENLLAAMFAYGNTGPFLDGAPVSLSVKHSIKFWRLIRQNPYLIEQVDFPKSIEDVFWFPLLRASSLTDFEIVLSEFDGLQSDELKAVFEPSFSEEIIYVWVDKLWQIVSEQQENTRNWQSALKLISNFEKVASRAESVSLMVALARARAIILADYLKQPDEAVKNLQLVTQDLTSNQFFAIAYTIASILLDMGNLDEALKSYFRAQAVEATAFEYYRFDSVRRITEIHGRKSDWVASATWCLKALSVTGKSEAVPIEDKIELVAELAWIRWNQSNYKQVAGAMFGVVMRFAEIYDVNSARHAELLNKIGHMLGWMVFVSGGGNENNLLIDGQPYVRPFPGWIARRRVNLSNLKRQGIEALIAQVGLLCSHFGVYKAAYQVYKLAYKKAIEGQFPVFAILINSWRSDLAPRFETAETALSIGISGIRILMLDRNNPNLSFNDLLTLRVDTSTLWQSLSIERKEEIEKQLFWSSIAPVIGYLLERGVSTDYALEVLSSWRVALQKAGLRNVNYWAVIIEFGESIFNPFLGRAKVAKQLSNNVSDDTAQQLFLYLGISAQFDTPLNEVALKQALVFEYLIRSEKLKSNFIQGVGAFIFRTWQHIATNRGFYLRSPMKLRSLLAGIKLKPNLSEVIRILLQAAEAVDVTYSDDIQKTFIGYVNE